MKILITSILMICSIISNAQLFTQIGVYRNDATTIYTTLGCQIPIRDFSVETYLSLPFWRGDDIYRFDNIGVHLSGSGMFVGISAYYHLKRLEMGLNAQYRTDIYIVPKVTTPYTYQFDERSYPVFLVINYNLYKDNIKIGGDISWNQVGVHLKLLMHIRSKRTICDL